MDVILTKLIVQLNTSVLVLLAVLGGMFFVLFKVGQWSEKFSHHHNRIDNFESLSDKVIAISTKVDLIYNFVNPNSMVRSHSPISLTDAGQQTSVDIGANALLTKYYAKLKRELDLTDPQNAYDIQQYSMFIAKEKLINFLDSGEINTVKDAAYRHGVLVEDILAIFGVMLRDKILAERNIPVAEVDRHTPPI